MQAFATLLDALAYMPSRNGKQRLIADYLDHAPDPDRGYGLAALTGDLSFTAAKAGMIKELVATRVDPALFGWSYDFVGDLAETVALIWPAPPGVNHPPPRLSEVVEGLAAAKRGTVPALLEGWLDTLDATGRWALLKLITGGLRIGVSARMAKTALVDWATANGVEASVEQVEELWHGLSAPYAALFGWLTGTAEKPCVADTGGFRPMMLAHPLEEADIQVLNPAEYRAEWKWDGIRVQLVARGTPDKARLYSRTGDEIAAAFPDVAAHMGFHAVLDGELLVAREGRVAPFNDLQQRLNRKRVTAPMLRDFPAWVRLYDMLFDGAEDLRALPFDERRRRLEDWFARTRPPCMDLSPLVPFTDCDHLAHLRLSARDAGVEDGAIEGLMLKRGDSAYIGGRPKGPWFKWKRGPLTADCVLMYAQRGHGKRSSFYSDYTFGAWRGTPGDGGELVPVGKAYFGFTDAELVEIDRWVRNHTTNRFGPVREVAPGLVFEVAFDSVHRSTRHKSGIAMRFPRVSRLRWDKPAAEADRLEVLERMVAS
ncbi:cisplatin damage response ATP-dependent DNA ligase [Niveispirillum sp.]|uniref:cisplatin damage response ATP-dependent DNA ligase n=1 Tax=Niveispirillum sp. TaxID=1917217 RepID=UPI001B56D91E|nr:cisplatin damage response ATP-dependent DNA ligase [Niveispirillum sp.]MBP7338015.1 cisplatin damage response ATP-dependent DNA ligase [Niveispirillum sp.]